MTHKKTARAVLILTAVAGVFYNSWPFGYILSNQTAHQGLASDLERVGHPYFWLFILCDILTAISAVVVAVLIRFKLWPELNSKLWGVVCMGLLLFGLFTAISALLPSQCTITPILRCGADGGKGLGLDAFFSSLAALGLLISLASLNRLGGRNKFSVWLTWLARISFLAWSVTGLWFTVAALKGGPAHLLQQLFLVSSGLALLSIGLSLNYRLTVTKTET